MTGPRSCSLAAALVAALCSAPTPADLKPLQEVVEALSRQGDPITYSTDLVGPDTQIDVDGISIAALRESLAHRGLLLQRIDDGWVIVRASAAVNPSPSVTIRSATGLPVERPQVRWRGQRFDLAPDGSGGYRVPARPGAVVSLSASQHQPRLVRLSAIRQEVVLEPVELIENVIVTGSRHRLAGRSVTGSLTSLDAEDLATIPTLGNDALRAAAQLPGMSSMGISGKPRIRGGLQDELLVRLDGVELLDGYHLADFQNIFSVVDDRSVESVDVYTGGFPARYGNRMSGVMDITTGRPGQEPRTELGISLFSLLANSYGGLNDGDTRYLASLRRGNLDQIVKQLDPDYGRPRYYDAFARIDHRLDDGAGLSAGAFYTRDDVTLQEDQTRALSSIDSRYLWTRLALDHGGGLQSTTTLAYTWSERSKRLSDVDEDSSQGGFLDHSQQLRKVSGRSDLSLKIDGALLEFGADLEYGRARYDSVAVIDRSLLGTILGGRSADGHDIHVDPEGLAGGAYLAAEVPLGKRLLLQPGIRWDFQAFNPEGTTYHVSPRLGLRYQPSPTLSLHLDVGRFHQPEALHELQAADGESSFFRPQTSDHVIAGVEWLIRDDWEIRAEAYGKYYRRVKQRYENLLNPFVLVPELEPDRVAIAPDRARATGLDLEVSRYLSERATASVRYSYMDAADRLSGRWVPRRWSQRHTASAMLSWQGATVTAAVALSWHSGWRSAALPETLAPGTTIDLARVMNAQELKDYLSLDASVRRTWQVGRSEITAFASITNLTNRDNVTGSDYEAQLESGRVLLQPTREALLPIVPSVGVLITF